MKAFVYILYFGKTDRYYVGSTSDISRRLKQHKTGHTYSTQKLGDFKLVFKQEVPSLQVARATEGRIKSWKRRDYVERIVQDGKIGFLSTRSSAG